MTVPSERAHLPRSGVADLSLGRHLCRWCAFGPVDLVGLASRADGDAALDYVDGLTLFSAADQQDLPDNLHPNAAGYARMGERFAKIAFDQGLFNRLSAS